MGFSTSSSKGVNANVPMKAGPSVKAFLTSIVVDKGNLKFTFENQTGKFVKTEFAINREHPSYKKQQEEWELDRITHIFSAFVPKEELDKVSGDTFEEWANGLVKLVGDKYKGVECTLKLIVNKRNYLDFPPFPNFLSTANEVREWVSNPTYDNYEYRKDQPDADGAVPGAAPGGAPPVGGAPTGEVVLDNSSEEDDLPF